MQQENVDVLRAQLPAKLINLGSGIAGSGRAVFRHELVAVARDALERDGEHLWHAVITFGGLEEANAAVIRVTDKPGELRLPKLTLHAAGEGAGSKSESRDFHVRLAERHPVRG